MCSLDSGTLAMLLPLYDITDIETPCRWRTLGADNDFEGRRWRPSVSEARQSGELPKGRAGIPRDSLQIFTHYHW